MSVVRIVVIILVVVGVEVVDVGPSLDERLHDRQPAFISSEVQRAEVTRYIPKYWNVLLEQGSVHVLLGSQEGSDSGHVAVLYSPVHRFSVQVVRFVGLFPVHTPIFLGPLH